MKKILAALAATAILSVSGSALAAPVSPGSPLILTYDFGSPISASDTSLVAFEFFTSLSGPIDGDTVLFEIVDDGSGSSGVFPGVEFIPPASEYSGEVLFLIDTIAFPIHKGDVLIDLAVGSGPIDIITFNMFLLDSFGDVKGFDNLLSPVPAPGALALLGFGLLGLRMRRRTA